MDLGSQTAKHISEKRPTTTFLLDFYVLFGRNIKAIPCVLNQSANKSNVKYYKINYEYSEMQDLLSK